MYYTSKRTPQCSGGATWIVETFPEPVLPAPVAQLWPKLLPAYVDGIVGALGV